MKSFTIISTLIIILLGGELYGQHSTMKGKKVIYRKEYGIGGGLTTSGFDLSYRKGKIRSASLSNFYEFEFANFRHNKEIKVVSERDYGAKYFVYGKKNAFYNIRTGIGSTKRIFEKSENNGVQVAYTFALGGSWGLVKPYYLLIGSEQRVLVGGEARPVMVFEDEKYDEDVDPIYNRFLNMDRDWIVRGPSGLVKGLGESTLLPGGYLKFGLNFEFSQYYDQLRAIEVGAILDLYADEIPVMIMAENKGYNVSLYLNIYFGKRKTH